MGRCKAVARSTMFLVLAIGGYSSSLHAVAYNFIEGRFLLDAEIEDGGFSNDGDGLRFAGSLLLAPELYAFVKYDDVEFDHRDVDFSYLRIGAGYIHPLDATWDSNISLAYASWEADGPRGDYDESGYEISGGVRGMVKPRIEVRAMLSHYDIENSDTYFTLGGDYYFKPNVSAGFELDMGGDYETFSIGAKYYF